MLSISLTFMKSSKAKVTWAHKNLYNAYNLVVAHPSIQRIYIREKETIAVLEQNKFEDVSSDVKWM